MDIKKNICKILWVTTALSISAIVICGIVLGCSGQEEPIYKAISLYGNYFGGISTIVAAMIAACLYTDWKKPIFISRISSNQKEIIKITRDLKRHADSFLLFMNSPNRTISKLNNDNEESLIYKKLVNTLLDDIDDLSGVLKIYKCNFDENIKTEEPHIWFIRSIENDVMSLFKILSKPNPEFEYMESFYQTKQAVESKEFNRLCRKIVIQLPDEISEFYASLIR
ncbi:hypothetical protein [Acinetobacter sp. YH12025]|uniref:hypothetical protein n=1 Tax=Acinetobacter sp. YH12025 TaxID=2601042 RepID=UPI0015D24A79|nr:hypothetical protein [Acinetobacter sp. YH12025]